MTIADELSIQLYSLREYGELAAQLDALADLGFKRVETVGRHLADAASVRAALDAHGMAAPTGHVNLADLREKFDWVVEQARTIGIEELYMPAVPPEDREGRPAEFWRALGAELGTAAERMADHGIALGYHNHNWELVPYQTGSTPLAELFAGAAGSPLTFEADLAWLVRGGADPAAIMAAERARVTAVHVKDIARVGENVDEDGWADIGDGTMDWPMLWAEAQSHGVKWMVLEHDKPSDAVRFARTGREFILRNFG
ncbi:sugar phosphate isomerase/epimerase [Acuticoccus sp. MNP-M23]|uniref:sugar phosphate isomerase/epimerase family protein n=1 Tax=Acuticoccus sp. MNP-M23 TaxID=3072793 RepID=UPI002814E8F4|nr:sugar phosphate isomerase/epimerase [Acuticoccus sp. MNP-M23]WMS42924.1 sugar phosphate isomerase/epimerase [Acuticoccus sp. MNP-M23]